VAGLVKKNQPKLFDYLLSHRSKAKIAPLVSSRQPLVYTSGRYPSEFEKTTVAVMVAEKSDKSGALMYDLRIDPDEFKDFSAGELAERWKARGEDAPYFPVKELKYNKCPAIAPLSVMDEASYQRLKLHPELVKNHLNKLNAASGFGDKLLEALDIMWPKRQPELVADSQKVDSQLYDGFVPDGDKDKLSVVRAAKPAELSSLDINFKDDRLKLLLPLYKARSFPKFLNDAEQKAWDAFRRQKLLDSGQVQTFFKRLDDIARMPGITAEQKYLLEELNLYAQSVVPTEAG
jgi:exodeoxyribonuclease I